MIFPDKYGILKDMTTSKEYAYLPVEALDDPKAIEMYIRLLIELHATPIPKRVIQ